MLHIEVRLSWAKTVRLFFPRDPLSERQFMVTVLFEKNSLEALKQNSELSQKILKWFNWLTALDRKNLVFRSGWNTIQSQSWSASTSQNPFLRSKCSVTVSSRISCKSQSVPWTKLCFPVNILLQCSMKCLGIRRSHRKSSPLRRSRSWKEKNDSRFDWRNREAYVTFLFIFFQSHLLVNCPKQTLCWLNKVSSMSAQNVIAGKGI